MLDFPFCNCAEVCALALGIVQLLWQPKWLQVWLMHSHDVPCTAVPPHQFPKSHGDFTGSMIIFAFSCPVNELLFFCLFSQVMWSNSYTWKRNDAGPFPLVGLSLPRWTWAEWLSMQRGRVRVAEKSHSVHLALLSVVISCLSSNFSLVQLKPWAHTGAVQWS